MVRRKPTMRAVWLGRTLRALREEARLTVRQFGDLIGKDGSTVSRVESGEQPVSIEVLDGYLEHCAVDDPRRRSDLLTIRSDVALDGWWDGYRKDISPNLMDRVWLESKATGINSFDIAHLPGLLQLPAYAESLMQGLKSKVSDEQIKRWVSLRIQRQHVLTRHRPVQFNAIIDGQLLRRRTGSVDTMRDQLDFLVELAERPNITIRILPSDAGLGVAGSFELFTLAPPYPRVGYVATTAGDMCVEGEALQELADEYARLEKHCLPIDESAKLMISERDAL